MRGGTRQQRDTRIFLYGIVILCPSPGTMKWEPSANIHNGNIANAAQVEIKVMVMERSAFPSKRTVQKLEAPPPGTQPEVNRPRPRLYRPYGTIRTRARPYEIAGIMAN
jgi:hypothetical protein